MHAISDFFIQYKIGRVSSEELDSYVHSVNGLGLPSFIGLFRC